MLVLHYFNWAGTPEEFKDFVHQINSKFAGSEGASLQGIFIPTSEWHYTIIWNVAAYEKILQIYKAYSEKYGPLKISLGKLEILHTIEEIPFL